MKKAKKKVVKKKFVKKMPLPYVIVRSHSSGVHFGLMDSRIGDTVTLLKSRRLWQWSGASLSQVGASGPSNAYTNKFGEEISKTEIVSPQGFEIIYCSDVAIEKILSVTPWKN